jgi:hypothetical protein
MPAIAVSGLDDQIVALLGNRRGIHHRLVRTAEVAAERERAMPGRTWAAHTGDFRQKGLGLSLGRLPADYVKVRNRYGSARMAASGNAGDDLQHNRSAPARSLS